MKATLCTPKSADVKAEDGVASSVMDIVLALLNNEFTVKRLYRRGGVVKLVAENNIYPIRLIKEEDDFVVWGVVTFNLHKLC